MPLFSWMRGSHVDAEHHRDNVRSPKSPTGEMPAVTVPGPTLMRELLWHIEKHKCRAREVKGHHHGHTWPLQAVIPLAERQELERLCDLIHPTNTHTVLHRLREVLSNNSFSPLDLPSIYKQLLSDFIKPEDKDKHVTLLQSPPPVQTQASQSQIQRGFLILTAPVSGAALRAEIPTVSRSVENSMSRAAQCSAHKDRSLPHYCPTTPLIELDSTAQL